MCNTLFIAQAEMRGRHYGGGGGPLKFQVYEARHTFIPDQSLFTSIQREQTLFHFEQMASQKIRSIFEELGFPLCRERECSHPEHPYEHVRPEVLTLEQVQQASPDRFELDRVVFDVLDLNDEERLEVYRAVAQLVKDRLVKAKSV
jgi:hypothetical protein